MIRISRLTDYAVALLSLMGDEGKQDLWSASELAQRSNLPLPTASKVLKLMSKSGLIKAQRGVTGGYKLARPITSISVAEVVEAMDGPIAVTDCAEGSLHKDCQIRNTCALRDGWGYVNKAIRQTLMGLTLQEMIAPPRPLANDAPRVAGD